MPGRGDTKRLTPHKRLRNRGSKSQHISKAGPGWLLNTIPTERVTV